MGARTAPAADDFRRRLFAAQRADPEETFYRVARKDGEVVGFIHASRPARTTRSLGQRRDATAGAQGVGGLGRQDATLEALYLLRAHHGTGLADHLMAALLDWLGDRVVRLEVATYNARAMRFYERYGFQLTGERALFRERIPIATMRRTGSDGTGQSSRRRGVHGSAEPVQV